MKWVSSVLMSVITPALCCTLHCQKCIGVFLWSVLTLPSDGYLGRQPKTKRVSCHLKDTQIVPIFILIIKLSSEMNHIMHMLGLSFNVQYFALKAAILQKNVTTEKAQFYIVSDFTCSGWEGRGLQKPAHLPPAPCNGLSACSKRWITKCMATPSTGGQVCVYLNT